MTDFVTENSSNDDTVSRAKHTVHERRLIVVLVSKHVNYQRISNHVSEWHRSRFISLSIPNGQNRSACLDYSSETSFRSSRVDIISERFLVNGDFARYLRFTRRRFAIIHLANRSDFIEPFILSLSLARAHLLNATSVCSNCIELRTRSIDFCLLATNN